MADLDDLLEDAFDAVKDHMRSQRKKRKKAKKARAERKNEERAAREVVVEPVKSTQPQAQPTQRVAGQSMQPANRSAPGGRQPLQWLRRGRTGPAIHHARLRAQLEQAEAYAAGIKRLVRTARNDRNRTRLNDLVRHTEHWQKSLRALVARVDAYQQNSLLQRDLETVPLAIQRLETQLETAPSPRLAGELERTLENRRRQLASLEKLHTTMQWAEIKIENTVSMLGAIYSQAHISQSKGQVADFRRLLSDVEEEARSLDDYVTAMAEVKNL